MTTADVYADRWTLPAWGVQRDSGGSPWLSDWVVDPLERVMLVAVVLLSAVLLWVVASERAASGTTPSDTCVLTAVDDARAFARVMGDHRYVPASFAVRSCGLQAD